MERLSGNIHYPNYNIKIYRFHRDCGVIASRSFSAENLFGEK